MRLIAGNTLREAARQRLFHFIVLLAFGLVLGARGLRDLNFGASELKFLADFGFGALAFFGAVLTIAASSQLFFSEIEHRTVQTLLARPVRRSEFLLGKFIAVAAVLAGFCAVLTLLLAAVVWSREVALAPGSSGTDSHGAAMNYALIAVAGFAQWLKFAVLAAFTLLVASFARTALFTIGTGFCILVICHLQYLAQEAAVRTGSAAGRAAATLVALVFPNFQVFDLTAALGADERVAWIQVARATLYAAGYAAAALGLAAYSFKRREI
jgi:ABC-type transport system involved in multi-copper enzyme maturation permease subunit